MSLIRSGFIVGSLTFLSRIFGFIRDIFISSALGTSLLADAFNIAFRLPNFFRRIFAEGAFSVAFVPIFSAKVASEGKESALHFASKVFFILLTCLIIAVLLLEFALPVLIYVMAPGFAFEASSERLQLAIALSRITLPYLLFISLASMLGGILNSSGKFTAYAASPIFLNLSMILALLCLSNVTTTKAHALAWGVLLAGIIQVGLLFISMRRAGLSLSKPQLTRDESVIKLLKNIGPAIMGGSIIQITTLIDQTIASFIPGAISILAYADRINQLPLALIGIAISTVLLPSLSKQLKSGDFTTAATSQNRAIEIALLLCLPCTVAIVMLAHPIIYFLFERGAFSSLDTKHTANALQALSLGLPAYILIKIFTTCFFATQDTKTPVKVAVRCLAINLVVNLILIWPLKQVGIALATSISASVNALILYQILRKREMLIPDFRLKTRLPRIICSSFVLALFLLAYQHFFAHLIYNGASLLKMLTFTCMIAGGGLVYLVSAILLRALILKDIFSN
jgi:putative peptidoglycan lipid II flippase